MQKNHWVTRRKESIPSPSGREAASWDQVPYLSSEKPRTTHFRLSDIPTEAKPKTWDDKQASAEHGGRYATILVPALHAAARYCGSYIQLSRRRGAKTYGSFSQPSPHNQKHTPTSRGEEAENIAIQKPAAQDLATLACAHCPGYVKE